MKWRLTYKEYTLMLGIIVAIVVIITLWLRPITFQANEDVSEKPTQTIIGPAVKILLERTIVFATKSIQ